MKKRFPEKSPSLLRAAGLCAGILAALAAPGRANELRIVATTTDVATVFAAVGGDEVEVEALCFGYQDPHYLEAKPSYVVDLRRADALAYVGLELEVGWLPLLVEGARNDRLLMGRVGNVPMSVGIEVLEIPAGEVSRAQGDVHPLGNPHFWLDPRNVVRMSVTAEQALTDLAPERAEVFAARAETFRRDLETRIQVWEERLAPWHGTEVVAYHKQWEYLASWLGLEIVDYVETRAGIPPSPRHVRELETRMRERDIPLVLISNFFEPDPAEKLVERTGATCVVLPASVGGEEGIDDPVALFEHLVARLEAAFREAKAG